MLFFIAVKPRLVGSDKVTVSGGKATIQVRSYPPTVERRDRLTRNGDDVDVIRAIVGDFLNKLNT